MADIDNLELTSLEDTIEPLGIRLARNISTRRRTLELTQAQLAERLGVETETLSRFERGKHLPSLSTLERLAGLLQITITELLAEHPNKADDDALVITSWLAHLSAEDKLFARSILKQCCDYLDKRELK